MGKGKREMTRAAFVQLGVDPASVEAGAPARWHFVDAVAVRDDSTMFDAKLMALRGAFQVAGPHLVGSTLVLDAPAGVAFGDLQGEYTAEAMRLWYAEGGPADVMARG